MLPSKVVLLLLLVVVADMGASSGGPSGRHWVLDPIDGTRGFVGMRQYSVCLGMLQDGQVQLGVLGCPNLPQVRRSLGLLLPSQLLCCMYFLHYWFSFPSFPQYVSGISLLFLFSAFSMPFFRQFAPSNYAYASGTTARVHTVHLEPTLQKENCTLHEAL